MKKVVLAYGGLMRSDASLLHAYFEVKPDGHVERESCQAFGEPLADLTVGEMAEFRVSDDGARVHKPGLKLSKMVADRALVATWQASHRAVEASELAWQKPLDSLMEALHPVRLAYHRLPEEQRAMLVAQVVRYIVDSEGG